jgi:hypothetical protein
MLALLLRPARGPRHVPLTAGPLICAVVPRRRTSADSADGGTEQFFLELAEGYEAYPVVDAVGGMAATQFRGCGPDRHALVRRVPRVTSTSMSTISSMSG